MCELLYSTGMRVGELLRLQLKDINMEDYLVNIIDGKGKKDRVVILTEIAKRYLEVYVKHVRPRLLNMGVESEYLFPLRDGRQYVPSLMVNRFRRYKELAEIKHQVSFHTFRRSFATHLLQEGVDIRHIQQLMGHSSLRATIEYINITIKDLYGVLVKCHPREKTYADKEIKFKGEKNR